MQDLYLWQLRSTDILKWGLWGNDNTILTSVIIPPQSRTAFREYYEIYVTGGITFFWGTLSPENASFSVEIVSGRLSEVTNLSGKARFAQSPCSVGLDTHSVQIYWKIHEGFVNILDRYLFWIPQDIVIFTICVQILVMWLKSSLFLREKYLLVCDLTWIQ